MNIIRIKTILLLILVSNFAIAQSSPVNVLVGKNDKEVQEYFKILISKSENSQLKIVKSATDYGDMTMKVELPMNEESIFNCLSITAIFHRLKNGDEVCVKQGVFGSDNSVQNNLAFIKDNFTFISDGLWKEPTEKEVPVEIFASFNKKENSYMIIYELENKK
ncbi:hypothetical protein ABIB40_004150 [Pedobacter sp. UYP30]|uniref:hypothetical protein n=1 Tax=Pedobacter sp. UYP30 TaxID=1756400 RepID=UPI003391CAC5